MKLTEPRRFNRSCYDTHAYNMDATVAFEKSIEYEKIDKLFQ
jgi:hypothetical protein